jgi:RNA polymerase sigma-70 factor (ECF subfamily)
MSLGNGRASDNRREPVVDGVAPAQRDYRPSSETLHKPTAGVRDKGETRPFAPAQAPSLALARAPQRGSTSVCLARRSDGAPSNAFVGSDEECPTARFEEVRVQELSDIRSDPGAFERFYRLHVEAVQRFVARRVDDPYLAADLTAEVFVAVIESAGSYRRSRGEPVAWLFGIARNVVADEHRRSARELRTAARICGRELVDEDDLAALHERIDDESAARALGSNLSQLPAGERAVLELVALDGLSVSEAGRALGIGAVAARVRLHRARGRLRGRLDLPNLETSDLPEVTT